MMAWKFL